MLLYYAHHVNIILLSIQHNVNIILSNTSHNTLIMSSHLEYKGYLFLSSSTQSIGSILPTMPEDLIEEGSFHFADDISVPDLSHDIMMTL